MTDVGEIKSTVRITVKVPHLIIETQSKLSMCKVYETCTFNVRIYNPLKVPLAVQLLVAPDHFLPDFKKYDCANHKTFDMADEEFENIIPDNTRLHNKECYYKNNEEIALIKQASENKPVHYKKHSSGSSFSRKIIEAFFDSDSNQLRTGYKNIVSNCYEKQPKKSEETKEDFITQSLFIGDKLSALVPGESSKILGPIFFQPTYTGLHNLSLILKNNYTVIDSHVIKVNVGYTDFVFIRKHAYLFYNNEYLLTRSSVRKELPKLVIDITPDEINRFVIDQFSIFTPIIIRTFELQNIGNIDAEISGVMLEDYSCEKEGFSLHNCGVSFLLKPFEVAVIQISYYLPHYKLTDKVNL